MYFLSIRNHTKIYYLKKLLYFLVKLVNNQTYIEQIIIPANIVEKQVKLN